MSLGSQILVVEDEIIVALDIQTTLEKFGYTVPAISDSGDSAIQQAAELQPDLVLMDIRLKGDIDGVEAAQVIRAELNIPVVYLTAYADEATLQRAIQSEPLGYLRKPFSEWELKKTIEFALYKHQADKQIRENLDHWINIFQSIGVGVIVTDAIGRITFINSVAEDLTGWRSREALGQYVQLVFQVLHSQTRKSLEDFISAALSNSATICLPQDCLLLSKDGRREIPVSGCTSPIRDESELVPGGVLVFKDMTQWKQLEEQRLQAILHDPLTELPNSSALMQGLARSMQGPSGRSEFTFLLVSLDVEQEMLSQAMSDSLLIEVGRRLENLLRFEDLVTRLEGYEFGVLLVNPPDWHQLLRVLQRIQEDLQEPFVWEGQPLQVSLRMGVVLDSTEVRYPEELLGYARQALEQARASGEPCFRIYGFTTEKQTQLCPPETQQSQVVWSTRDEQPHHPLQLHYQPLISLKTGRIAGVEALLRWQHPKWGLLAAADFMQVAEASGSIISIGRWVYQEACQQLCLWQEQLPDHPALTMCINLSPLELAQPELVEQLTWILQMTGLLPQRLQLEIKFGEEDVSAIPILHTLSGLGVQLYLGQVGSGYLASKVSDEFPIHGLKLDPYLVSGLGSNDKVLARVRAIAQQAKAANLELIAEGVETVRQLDCLRQLEFDYAQGYYFAPPLLREGITALLRSACQW